MSKVIVLDPGHGGSDPGAVANGLREKDLTLDICKRIKRHLEDNYTGIKVHMTRTTDKYLSLSQRAQYANNKKADLFVSVHINAGGGTGYEDFVYNKLSNSSTTAKMRNTFHTEVVKEQSFWRNRGKKKANFAVLRLTKMSAILTENGFIDTKSDANKLKSNTYLNRIAKGHAGGIAKALGLKKKSKPKKSTSSSKKSDFIAKLTGKSKTSSKPKKTVSKPKTTNKSIAQMAQEVIDGKHGNGHENRRRSLGIDKATYEKVRAEVNRRLGVSTPKPKTASKPKKSISQMATEIIQGKHGIGHENRRKSLGIDKATYEKVRKEVNRRLK